MGKRTQLLPPYLEDNQVWIDLVDALDELWANGTLSHSSIDGAIQALRYLRYPYVLSAAALAKIDAGQMLNPEDFDSPDRSLLIQQTNLLGLPITNSSLLSDEDYLRLFRNLGHYWFSKGKANFIDFLSYCLNTNFTLVNLWTTDYVDFYEEGDPTIGIPVWEGGDWYPTTHVRLAYDAAKYTSIPTEELTRLFYDFANYNLVLLSIDQVASPKMVLDDSQLWDWGDGTSGSLGVGSTSAKSSPVQVGSLTTWQNVANANYSTAAVQSDGTLWAWGSNTYGSLGIGDVIGRSSPVQVGLLTDWSSVSKGTYFAVGVKRDGTLWSWGYNASGQLGLNNLTTVSSPVQVGLLTNWRHVSCGDRHVAAIKTDGTLWVWGYGLDGQLGIGVALKSSPVQVGALTNWSSVSAGLDYTLAVKSDGTLWGWGKNGSYQLGLGNTTTMSSPVQVGVDNNWRKADANLASSLGLRTDGTLWTWGSNSLGQLGIGNTTTQVTPTQVGTLAWSDAAMGSSTAYGIRDNGTLWSWGSGGSGRLGTGSSTSTSSPVQVGALATWKAVIAADSVFALRADIDYEQASMIIMGGFGEVEETIANY